MANQEAPAANSGASSPFSQPNATTPPPNQRKIVEFVRSEPGYRISLIINAFFLLNGILFGLLALIVAFTNVRGPVQVTDQYEIYDIIGTSLFCFWNSMLWSLILIFPSITTTNRERVRINQLNPIHL